MGKPNKRHHELCLRYKQEGRRERNKKIRAERNERRIAKFAARRAEKEERVWDGIPKDPEERGGNKEKPFEGLIYRPRMDNMLPLASNTSFFRRLRNMIDAEIHEKKLANNKNKEGKAE